MVDRNRNSDSNSGSGRGQVKDPEHDGRLKQNRDGGNDGDSRSASSSRGGGSSNGGSSGGNNRSRDEDGQFSSAGDGRNSGNGGGSRSASSRSSGDDDSGSGSDSNWEPGRTGAVLDPEHDGRLKENREDGVTLGTTEHSAQAPGAINKDDMDQGRSSRGSDDRSSRR